MVMSCRGLTIDTGVDPSLSVNMNAASSKRASIESSLSFVMLRLVRMVHSIICTQKVAEAFRRVSFIRVTEYNVPCAHMGYEFICMVHKENVKSSSQIV